MPSTLDSRAVREILRAEAAYEVPLATIKRLEARILSAARENPEISLR